MRFRARSKVSNEERRLDRAGAGGSPPCGTGAEKEGGVTNEIEKRKELKGSRATEMTVLGSNEGEKNAT